MKQDRLRHPPRVVKALAEAEMMKVAATHEAGSGMIMAQGSQNSLEDEWLTILFPTPLIVVFAVIGAGSRHRSFTVIPTTYWSNLSKLSQLKIGSRCSLSFSKKSGG